MLIFTVLCLHDLTNHSYYGDGSKQYPTSQSHIMLGLCTGQLAACTVASAANINELVKLAVEAVVIAFRTGLHVTKTRELLENGPDKNKEWAYIVPKLQVDLAASRIEQFSQSAVSLSLIHELYSELRLTVSRTYQLVQDHGLAQ
jgi:hypothetical protein